MVSYNARITVRYAPGSLYTDKQPSIMILGIRYVVFG